MKKIRVAMLRADCHAYTFGPLMAECDITTFAKLCHAEYHWMIDAYRPEKLKPPVVPGFEIVKVWDYEPKNAQEVSDMFFGKPQVCTTIEEMTKDVDAAFINNGNLDGGDHLRLASPFLKKGIPTYIDKPIAPNIKLGREIIKLARKHKTPVFSSSILRYVNEVQFLKARLPEMTGPLKLGVVRGLGGRPGGPENLGGIIHSLSLAHEVFGDGIEWVHALGELPMQYILWHYQDGKEVMILNSDPDDFDKFICDVYSKCGTHCPPEPAHLRSNTMGDREFVIGAAKILKDFRKMVQTGKPPVAYETMLELTATLDAARKSQKTGKKVFLNEFLNEK